MYAAVAVGALVLVAAVVWFQRRDTGYKVDEFARARSLTSEWARRAEGSAPGTPDAADAADVAAQSRNKDRPAG